MADLRCFVRELPFDLCRDNAQVPGDDVAVIRPVQGWFKHAELRIGEPADSLEHHASSAGGIAQTIGVVRIDECGKAEQDLGHR